MAFTAGFSVNVGDPTKASDVDVLAANDDYLKNAIDTFIANDANNRVLTGTGSGTANAETNLTFDGSTLTVTGTVSATTFSGNVTGNLSGNVTGGTISGTTGTFSGDVAVDTDTLFVDASADRVGINTASPTAALHIDGTGGASNQTSQLRISLNGTTEGIFGVSSFANNIISGSTQGDTTIRNDGGNIHFSTDSGSSIAATIDSSGNVTVGSAGAAADFAVWTDGTSSTAAGFTVDASADEVIVGQLSGGGNTTFKVRNRLNNTVFSVTPDAPSTTVFAPNIATGSAGTLTVKTGSINSDSIRLEAGGTTSTWLESRGYLGHSWYVDSTRSMTLDSTGLGIGTDSPKGLIDIDSTGRNAVADLGDADDYALVIRNPTSTGQGNGICFTNDDAVHVGGAIVHIDQGSNNTGDLAFYTRDTGGSVNEAMRIDNSQRVGIGTVSPQYKLVVSNGGAAGYEFNVNGLNSGVNTLTYNRSTSAYVDSAHFVNNYYIYSGQTPAERFRVESTGVCAFMTPNINIRFNGTATQSVLTNNDGVEIYTGGYIWAGRQAASLYLNRAGTTGDVAVFYYNNTTAVGSISVTSSATAYNTSSDYRLKENLVPITGAVDRVNALQPRRFNFISDPDTTVDGFVAHEVSPVVPEAISGEKDAVDEDGNPEYQGIDQSKLVPLLTAAIQELTARIEALEAA